LFCLTTKQQLNNPYHPISKSQLVEININRFLDLLIFVSETISKTQNMFITPEEIFESNG
jgi:hypothetical protein